VVSVGAAGSTPTAGHRRRPVRSSSFQVDQVWKRSKITGCGIDGSNRTGGAAADRLAAKVGARVSVPVAHATAAAAEL
jgi:hypothetical protein